MKLIYLFLLSIDFAIRMVFMLVGAACWVAELAGHHADTAMFNILTTVNPNHGSEWGIPKSP